MRRTFCTILAAAIVCLDGWGAPLAGMLLLAVNWDYFSGIAGGIAEGIIARRTSRQLHANRHANVKAYWVLAGKGERT
jgi:hypothetical protein